MRYLFLLVAEGAVSTKMNTLASIKNTFVLIFLTTIFFYELINDVWFSGEYWFSLEILDPWASQKDQKGVVFRHIQRHNYQYILIR